MTTEGFEPSPLRNSALNYRLRPLGQIVIANFIPILFEYKFILFILIHYYKNKFLSLNFVNYHRKTAMTIWPSGLRR